MFNIFEVYCKDTNFSKLRIGIPLLVEEREPSVGGEGRIAPNCGNRPTDVLPKTGAIATADVPNRQPFLAAVAYFAFGTDVPRQFRADELGAVVPGRVRQEVVEHLDAELRPRPALQRTAIFQSRMQAACQQIIGSFHRPPTAGSGSAGGEGEDAYQEDCGFHWFMTVRIGVLTVEFVLYFFYLFLHGKRFRFIVIIFKFLIFNFFHSLFKQRDKSYGIKILKTVFVFYQQFF